MSSSRKQINLRIDEDLCAFIDSLFPSYGGRQWFFESCAKKCKELYESADIIPPSEIVDSTIRDLLSEASEPMNLNAEETEETDAA